MNRSLVILSILMAASPALAQPTDPENPLTGTPPTTPTTPTEPIAAPPPPPTYVPPPPPPPPAPMPGVDPTMAPATFTMDHMDGASRLGGELVFPLLAGGKGRPSSTMLRLELHGQYVTPDGIGGYFQLPLNFLHTAKTMAADADNAFGLGNIELGVIYALRSLAPDWGMVLHFGIVAPSGNTPDDDPLDIVDGATANATGAFVRVNDILSGIPRGLSARVGMTPIWRHGKFFGRGDLGFDFNIDYDNGLGFAKERFGPLLHFNFGGGYDDGRFSVAAEFVNVFNLADLSGANTNADAYNSLAFGARFPRGNYQPYVYMTFPLDDETSFAYDFVFTVGLDVAMPN